MFIGFIGTWFQENNHKQSSKKLREDSKELMGFTTAGADIRQSDGANGWDSWGGQQREKEHSKEHSAPLVRLGLLRAGRQVSC